MSTFKTLTPDQVLVERTRDSVKLVDVRTTEEWNEGHIPGALHLPLSDFASLYKSALETDDEIIIYCLHGVRSKTAAQFLAINGYTNVSHMAGGLTVWNGTTISELDS